jgi:hypothetical protein
MKKHFTLKRILLYLLIILVIMQFFRIDKTQPAVVRENDFMFITQPPEEMASMLRSSCYDCHSYEATYPWYSNIAPVSWWLQHHVDEGRGKLNFSVWGTYASRKKDHKLEECIEMTQTKEMPLNSYTWLHNDAKLTDQQRTDLVNWFNSKRTFESEKK